jgi:predicted kinase
MIKKEIGVNKTCYVLVGLPASGKSTLTHKIKNKNPSAFIYSTDNFIESVAEECGLTYGEVFADVFEEAIRASDKWLEVAMKYELPIIWDQPNLGVSKRLRTLNKLRKSGYKVKAYVFLLPETPEDWSELVKRYKNRIGKEIPVKVLSTMSENYKYPTEDEGFDEICFYNIYGEEQ